MINKITVISLWVFCNCQAEKSSIEAESCLKKNPNYYGKLEGNEVSDWTYLIENEVPEFTFRLTDIAMCTDSADNFKGMQLRVGKFEKKTGEITGY